MHAGLENTIYIWHLSYKLYFRTLESLPVNSHFGVELVNEEREMKKDTKAKEEKGLVWFVYVFEGI